MRGLSITVLLAPVLASAFAAPSIWDDVDNGPPSTSTDTSASLGFGFIYSDVKALHDPPRYSYLEVDIVHSGTECGSGDISINGTPTPYGLDGTLEIIQDGVRRPLRMTTRWMLICGTTQHTLIFSVDILNGRPVTDTGISVIYSQEGTSLKILSYRRFNSPRMKTATTKYLTAEEQHELRLKYGWPRRPQVVPATQGTHTSIAERPPMDDVDAVLTITTCDSVKCVVTVAYHHTKEAAKHVKSKVKSMFGGHGCQGKHPRPKHRESHPPKCSSGHGRQNHNTHGCHNAASETHHHKIHGHSPHWHHNSHVPPRGHLFIFLLFVPALIFFIHYRLRCAKRAAARVASCDGENDRPRKRRGCLGWRRRRSCRHKKPEYSEKDGVLPFNEPSPAYTMPSHIATEIADLRSAAEAVEDIVSQSSEGSRYARRGSSDTMDTLPEYTAQEADVKMDTEELPGYSDSEELVSVADGYQPGTGEVWRERVDGVDVKI